MILTYIVWLVSSVSCLKLIENDNNILNQKVTTLYPVENITYHVKEVSNELKQKDNRNSGEDINELKSTDTISRIKLKESKINGLSKLKDVGLENELQVKMLSKEKQVTQNGIKLTEMTSWKVNATYTKSKLNEDRNNISDNSNNTKNESKGKHFKPSPHLGNFYDENEFVVPSTETLGSFTPIVTKPSLEFVSSPRDFFPLDYKQPVNSYHGVNSPYKFEQMIPRTKYWKFETGLEVKPTMESPVMIPAGGLYKLPDAFKEKPSSDGDDDDFGLAFKDSKDTPLRKRSNPWKKILNFVTALVPVGIIISALTPSIVTLESTGNNPRFPSRISRRSEESDAELPSISERCKRRLLCELHSSENYMRDTTSPRRPNQCYKIPCNDPQALSKVLRWLLQRNASHGYRNTLHDRRGFITISLLFKMIGLLRPAAVNKDLKNKSIKRFT